MDADKLPPDVLSFTPPPEVRAWSRRQFTEEEVLTGLREVREQGGLELADFLPELERLVEEA